MQTNFNYNMNTLLDKQLKQTGIMDCLYEFINHGVEIIRRKAEFDLNKLDRRLHLLEGLLSVLNDLDQALEIIRQNENPKEGLQSL